MALSEYRAKRNFTKTTEPSGKSKKESNTLRFVVQKHDASRLHYDFRLELDGVLKSWAVPKGPSLNPEDKRLAVMVEDHPVEYMSFEGTIPEGNYGAGTVIVWDIGFYTATNAKSEKEVVAALHKGLKKGHLQITLHGFKLQGDYDLVRLKDEKNWLLIKRSDEFATTTDVMEQSDSVIKQFHSKQSNASFIQPMLAENNGSVFDDPEWLFDIKWDGYRAIAEIHNHTVRLYSRNAQMFNEKYPSIAAALGTLPNCIVDGEIVALDKDGKPSFQDLQNNNHENLVYFVFDVLEMQGDDLRMKPLQERKKVLDTLLADDGSSVLRQSPYDVEHGSQFLVAAKKMGLEGVIAKKTQSLYREGVRSNEWQKIKLTAQQEIVVVGYTEPRGSRKYFGSLIMAVFDGLGWQYVGHVGTGFDDILLQDLYKKFQKIETKSSPFSTKIKTNTPVQWLEPKFIAEVRFHEWTSDGVMRHPVFMGLRDDKSIFDVRWEEQTSHVVFTHPEKVYWPKDGYTKADVIKYYQDVASIMLPYLLHRPHNLHRHPHGIDGESFYQKNMEDPPEWLKTKVVRSESEDKEVAYLVCEKLEDLMYMVQLGCIEINPWNSIAQKLENPTYAVIDLDPHGVGFDTVVDVAKVVRTVLELWDVPSYPKTSGLYGLHIYIPLDNQYDYYVVRQFAEMVVTAVHEKLPKTTSVERNPEKRKRKLYLDYLQNRRGQTLAAPYSLRPKEGAPFSAPLEWSEVTNRLRPDKFTIKTITKRLDTKGDLFKPVLEKGIDLPQILKKIQKAT